jgi:predicted phage tail component-like protein
MAGISITYNGVDLAQWMVITDVARNIGANHTNTMTKVGKSDGQMWQYSSLDSKTIVVAGAVLNDNLAVVRRELGAALEHDGPAPLILGDDTSVYYNALADGQASITEDWRSGSVSITFVVPDGVAHAVTPSTFNNHGSDGLMTDKVVVSNKGSYKAYPVITAKMIGQNGVVSLANSNGGALQFGNPEEIDGTIEQRSEEVFHYTFDSAPTDVTLNDGVVAYPNYLDDSTKANLQTGPFDYARTKGTATPASVRTKDEYWSGPSMSGSLKPNSAGKLSGNFQWVNRLKFATKKRTVGRCEFNLTKGDKVVASFLLYDDSLSVDKLMFEGTVNGQHLFLDNLPRNYYKDGEYDFVITKMGAQVTFRLNRVGLGGGGVEIRTVDGFDTTEVDGWTVWLTGFSDNPGWSMNWEDSYFDWINVNYWNDIPNRFKDGDKVTIDVANRAVYLNDVEENSLQTVGNNWESFALPTGDTTIELVQSSWADMYDCTIAVREAYV